MEEQTEMVDHKVSIAATPGLFGGTIYIVRCVCGWSVIGMEKETMEALKRAHTEGAK